MNVRRHRNRKPAGHLVANMLLLVIVLVIGLGLMEAAVRVAMPQFDVSGHVRFVERPGGPPLGPAGQRQRQIKNTGDFDVAVAFNRHGFRDEKDIASATAEDWFVVGDSFAFGYGVEETQRFSNLLQAEIGRQVFNIAIPTDLDGYARLVRYAEAQGAPIRRLIISVCMENDVFDYNAAATAAAPPPPRLPVLHLAALKQWLQEHSSLYFAATTLVHGSPVLSRWFASMGLLVPNLDGLKAYDPGASPIGPTVDRIAALAAGRDASAVLIIPSRRLWVGDFRAQENRLHAELVEALEARGLTVIDPRPAFEGTGRPLAYHFANDGHWNAEGHRIAAGLLAARLASAGASPQPGAN